MSNSAAPFPPTNHEAPTRQISQHQPGLRCSTSDCDKLCLDSFRAPRTGNSSQHFDSPVKTLINRKQYRILDEVTAIFLKKWLPTRRHRLVAREKQVAVFAYDLIGIEINVHGTYGGRDLNALFHWLHETRPASFFEGTELDVGANIGNHALYFADHFRRVRAYEANPRTFALLKVNAGLASNVECFNVGVSSSRVRSRLRLNKLNIGGARIVEGGDENDVEIELQRLDDMCPADDRVTFIKIDVEGHERDALLGARRIISEYRPLIIFEQAEHDFSSGQSPTVDLLRSYGYEHFYTLEAGPTWAKYLPRFLRYFAVVTSRLIFGESRYLIKRHQFEPRFYPFILAAHGSQGE